MAVITRIFAILAVLSVAACQTTTDTSSRASPPDLSLPVDPPPIAALADQADVAALAREILALSPSIDPEEAARAAAISYSHTAVLRAEYQIVDPPLIHNAKVNAGIKPRGLCWHWAEDMERRLKAEQFTTLDLHRAIANHDNIRVDHSTAIVSAKGADMYQGIVVDPWRKGGELTWIGVLDDRRYKWAPRSEVLKIYAAREAR